MTGLEARIKKIFAEDNESLIEAVYLEAKEQIANDYENPHREGRFFLQAFLDNDPQQMLLALCGWNINSLILMAEASIKEESV